jgi:hypothetical protein
MAASRRKGDVATLLTALLVFLVAGSVSGKVVRLAPGSILLYIIAGSVDGKPYGR